jgi:hypothetical protein
LLSCCRSASPTFAALLCSPSAPAALFNVQHGRTLQLSERRNVSQPENYSQSTRWSIGVSVSYGQRSQVQVNHQQAARLPWAVITGAPAAAAAPLCGPRKRPG